MFFEKLGIKSILLWIMQIKDLNSLLFLGGGSFSKGLIFLGSGITPRDEKIISKNAIYVFSKRTVFGVKC